MIIDSDPVTFEYGGNVADPVLEGPVLSEYRCEIGVYYTDEPDLSVRIYLPGHFTGASITPTALICRILFLKTVRAFHREEKHWWLTGFMPGNSPTMGTHVKSGLLQRRQMCASFIRALKRSAIRITSSAPTGFLS
jgi:hypothetical protein